MEPQASSISVAMAMHGSRKWEPPNMGKSKEAGEATYIPLHLPLIPWEEDEVNPFPWISVHFWPFTWIPLDSNPHSLPSYKPPEISQLSLLVCTFQLLFYHKPLLTIILLIAIPICHCPKMRRTALSHDHQLPCLHCSPHDYIRMVQHLIERCLLLKMTRDDCVKVLAKRAGIRSMITVAVWKELMKENRGFFDAYFQSMPARSYPYIQDMNSQPYGSPQKSSRFSRRRHAYGFISAAPR